MAEGSVLEVVAIPSSPDDPETAPSANLQIVTATAPVFAGNQITKTVENCTNARISDVMYEVHHHYSSSPIRPSSDCQDNEQGSLEILKQKCRWKSLIAKYRREDAWLTPLPWDPDVQFDPDDHFVQVDMEIRERSGRFVKGYSNELKDIFTPVPGTKSKQRPERILIRGDAGFGKTTLCNKIVFDWATDDRDTFANVSSETSVLLFYRLRDLGENALLEPELIKYISENCSISPHSEDSLRKLTKDYAEDFILLLDGFDELSENHQKQVVELLHAKPSSVFRLSSVIVTTRLHVDKNFLLLFDKHIILKGLTENTTELFARKYFQNSNTDVAIFLRFLQNAMLNSDLSPLFVTMLCYLVKLEPENLDDLIEVDKSKIQVFRKCIFLVAKRSTERESLGLDELQLSFKLRRLGRFFLICLTRNQLKFSHCEMKLLLEDDYAFALVCGLLRSVTYDGTEFLEPVHKTFMENLALFYLEEEWTGFFKVGEISEFLELFDFTKTTLEITFSKDMITGNTKTLVVLFLSENFSPVLSWIISENEARQLILKHEFLIGSDYVDFLDKNKVKYLRLEFSNRVNTECVMNARFNRAVIFALSRIHNDGPFLHCLALFLSRCVNCPFVRFNIDTDSEVNTDPRLFDRHSRFETRESVFYRNHPFLGLSHVSVGIRIEAFSSAVNPTTLAHLLQSIFPNEFHVTSLRADINVNSFIQSIKRACEYLDIYCSESPSEKDTHLNRVGKDCINYEVSRWFSNQENYDKKCIYLKLYISRKR